jgi:hypothetical protein
LFSESESAPAHQMRCFDKSGFTVEKYVGNKSHIMRLNGLILSPEDEKGLMNMWIKSRLDVNQYFESGPIDGGQIREKVLIHDLTINRKTGRYVVGIRTYSGNDFTNEKPNKNAHVSLKS